jgi:hypothetical protein
MDKKYIFILISIMLFSCKSRQNISLTGKYEDKNASLIGPKSLDIYSDGTFKYEMNFHCFSLPTFTGKYTFIDSDTLLLIFDTTSFFDEVSFKDTLVYIKDIVNGISYKTPFLKKVKLITTDSLKYARVDKFIHRKNKLLAINSRTGKLLKTSRMKIIPYYLSFGRIRKSKGKVLALTKK